MFQFPLAGVWVSREGRVLDVHLLCFCLKRIAIIIIICL